MTDVCVELASADRGADAENALRSLRRWLHEDETLAGAVRGRFADPADPVAEHMGAGGFDILQLALGSGLSTASFVVSVLQWQLARNRAPALVLSRGELRVEVSPESAGDAETLRRVVELLDRQPPVIDQDGEPDGGGAA
ncbi:effector-associated constant component EACC1 [Streptomyces violascens]|uniref:Uncharacterized protein n=1 Tax=Streptomyces violascens TaxID=67381 RepID=A0ABQ3QHX2_9ACTN|nr:hypothetical protein [Streptomyces violascens]GGU03783.1 hypothetical protein GCM10010289_25970 [Streptomyces violascens]GHI36877.1 hypothetical protein Sviol_12850 [Streptomyces violascens]